MRYDFHRGGKQCGCIVDAWAPQFEMDRLDLAHAMMVKAMGSVLFRAPLKKEKVHRILDIGTGTGICKSECTMTYG